MTAPVALSAWCAMPPGITRHDSQHRVCQMRLDSGQGEPCDCPDGHTTKETP